MQMKKNIGKVLALAGLASFLTGCSSFKGGLASFKKDYLLPPKDRDGHNVYLRYHQERYYSGDVWLVNPSEYESVLGELKQIDRDRNR